MQTQTLFQAGNSTVVAIPKHLLKEFNLRAGNKVIVDKSTQNASIVVKAASQPVVKPQKTADKEFKKWLDVFEAENGEILDELALR